MASSENAQHVLCGYVHHLYLNLVNHIEFELMFNIDT